MSRSVLKHVDTSMRLYDCMTGEKADSAATPLIAGDRGGLSFSYH